MSRKIKTLHVTIMEKEYPVACPPGQEATLMDAVDQVDKLMHTIKRNGRTVGVERIAVMAALNMAHDLLAMKESLKDNEHTSSPQTPTSLQNEALGTQSKRADEKTDDDPEAAEKLHQIAEEEAAIARQLQALTEKLESALSEESPSPSENNDTASTQTTKDARPENNAPENKEKSVQPCASGDAAAQEAPQTETDAPTTMQQRHSTESGKLNDNASGKTGDKEKPPVA